MTWEASVTLESQVALTSAADRLSGNRYGEPTLLLREKIPLPEREYNCDLPLTFRRRLTCMTQRSGCLYSGSSRY